MKTIKRPYEVGFHFFRNRFGVLNVIKVEQRPKRPKLVAILYQADFPFSAKEFQGGKWYGKIKEPK